MNTQLSTREYGGHVVAGLSGELDAVDAADVAAAVTAIMTAGQCLIVDLAALEFIDCCALGALLGVQQRAQQEGGDMLLAEPKGLVLRVLTLTGWDSVFSFHASVAAAAASTGGAAPRYFGCRNPTPPGDIHESRLRRGHAAGPGNGPGR